MLRRRSALKARKNAEGKPRERFEGLRDEPFREWIRNQPCILAGREGHRCWSVSKRSEACHVESKARGAGDAGNLLPMCTAAHRDQHDYGIKSFEREYGVKLRALAGAYWLEYEQQQGAPTL